MARERCADEEVEGVVGIDGDASDRAALGGGDAARKQNPEVASVPGLEKAGPTNGACGR
jgi:hypothetical protein